MKKLGRPRKVVDGVTLSVWVDSTILGTLRRRRGSVADNVRRALAEYIGAVDDGPSSRLLARQLEDLTAEHHKLQRQYRKLKARKAEVVDFWKTWYYANVKGRADIEKQVEKISFSDE